MKFTKKESDYLYNLATKRFLIGDYNNAFACYYVLSSHDPLNYLYTKALAGCAQKQKYYDQGYYYYMMAYQANKEEIDCVFYAAVCLF